jgi:hypothetical protein
MFLIGLAVGLFIGTFLGIALVAILSANDKGD